VALVLSGVHGIFILVYTAERVNEFGDFFKNEVVQEFVPPPSREHEEGITALLPHYILFLSQPLLYLLRNNECQL
jgi:hypothetical protein